MPIFDGTGTLKSPFTIVGAFNNSVCEIVKHIIIGNKSGEDGKLFFVAESADIQPWRYLYAVSVDNTEREATAQDFLNLATAITITRAWNTPVGQHKDFYLGKALVTLTTVSRENTRKNRKEILS